MFTAGIGENSPVVRRALCEKLAWLGVAIDDAANDSNAQRISTPESLVSLQVIPTNEEVMIAERTAALIGN